MLERDPYATNDVWDQYAVGPTYDEPTAPSARSAQSYPWWSDPDTPPPDWMLDQRYPAGHDAGPGYYWYWAGDHWQQLAAPRASNPTVPPPGGDGRTDPLPPGGGGDWLSGSGGGPDYSGIQWPSYSMPSFEPGTPFSYRDFTAPNGQDVLKDPGFQFRMDQGRKALESSAAGKGILRSGGTLKDLMNYGQNFASQEYGNVYDRALREYDTNRRNAWDTWNTGYTGRKDKYSFDVGNAQFDYSGRQRQAEFDRNDIFNRWAKEGDWLSNLAVAGLE